MHTFGALHISFTVMFIAALYQTSSVENVNIQHTPITGAICVSVTATALNHYRMSSVTKSTECYSSRISNPSEGGGGWGGVKLAIATSALHRAQYKGSRGRQ